MRSGDQAHASLGSAETANLREITRLIHLEGTRSCQLVMGFTQLAPGSVWNTMPAHTHMRRSEVYLYFDLDADQRVVHLMGRERDAQHRDCQQTSRHFAGLVDSRRSGDKELHLLLGNGRRKPGL